MRDEARKWADGVIEIDRYETVLEEAQRLTHGDRPADYGHPLDDFSCTAQLWSALLGIPVTAEQVGLCMIAVKLSRESRKAKRDNRTDIAGYAEALERLHVERARRAANEP